MSDHLRELTAGVIGGCTATLLEYPFDTVKVRLQDARIAARYTGYADCFRTILREEGLMSGFYSGVSAALTGSAVEHAIMFWSYRIAARNFQTLVHPSVTCVQDEESYDSVAFGGAACGVVASCFLTPIELVKCRMQVQNTLPKEMWQYKSALHCASTVLRRDGPLAMYRGNTAMLAREIPGCMAYFLTFQLVARSLLGPDETVQESPFYKHLLAGGLAGVAFWTALYPADVVKTRMQTQAGHSGALLSSLAMLYKKEGFRAMYRGWGITVVRAFPANAVLLAVYQKVDELWDHCIVPTDRFALKHEQQKLAATSTGHRSGIAYH